MAAIPTILKGDDSGSITLTLATGKTYTGATLVAAYQGVTRQFTDLTAGQTITFSFTHDETSGFELGTRPLLMRLIGQTGSEETVENAEARIKVTDCLGEVNAGGSFIIKPGEQGAADKVPITDVGDVATRYTLADLQAKVNEIVHVLAQRSLLALAVAAAAFVANADVMTARLDALYNDSLVVTNVTGAGGGGVDTNAVCDIVTNDAAVAWTTGRKTPDTYLPSCAITNIAVRWNSSAAYWEVYLKGINDGVAVDGWYTGYVYDLEAVDPFETVNTDYNSLTVTVGRVDFSSDVGRCVYATRARATHNALGLAYERDLVPTITQTVTKAYVEGLGISGGGAPVDYATVSNRAMNAYQHGETRFTNDVAAIASGALPSGIVTTNASGAIVADSFSFQPETYSTTLDIGAKNYEKGRVNIGTDLTGVLHIGNDNIIIERSLDSDGYYNQINLHANNMEPAYFRMGGETLFKIKGDDLSGLLWDWHTNTYTRAETDALIDHTLPHFSNEVLAVGLGIGTNEVAQINAILNDMGETPIGEATTVGALLTALAAAIAWLKKKKIDKLTCGGVSDITTDNGTANVSTLFSSDNTSLTSTIGSTIASRCASLDPTTSSIADIINALKGN